jgi:MFS transporter, UMF1 family
MPGKPRDSQTGKPLFPKRRAQLSWALLDWAHQPYFTLITTFIFAPYFAASVIGDTVRGQALWGYTQAAVGLTVALASPVLGAVSDRMGRRKPWIAAFGLLYVMGNLLLGAASPGAAQLALFLILAVVAAGAAAEFMIVFSNAMLPDLAHGKELGRLSGFGWALGYMGGLLSLILMISLPDAGFEAGQWVGPLTAAWFLVFALPLFLFTPDRAKNGVSFLKAVREGLGQLRQTLLNARKYRNAAWFLLAHMIYADGLAAIYGFGGIYAAGLFGWETRTLGLFGVILILFGVIGSLAGGWADDRFGSRRTVLASVAGLILALIGALSITQDSILFGIRTPSAQAGGAPFGSISEMAYLGVGALIGLCGGPAQAASRTLLARLAPREMAGEFYGLFAMSGKATSFFAPLMIGVITLALGSQRAGLTIILVFLAAGFFLMLRVREAAE